MAHSPFWSRLAPFTRHKDEIETRLKQAPMFRDISARGIRIIRDLCHLREYTEGEHIFRSGEPGVGMFVILDGRVEIYRQDKKQFRHFAELEPGDFFGELALLEETPRTASAKATTSARVVGFFRPDLISIMDRKPRLGVQILFNMAQLIGQRLIHANEVLERLDSQQIAGNPKSNLRKQIWHDVD